MKLASLGFVCAALAAGATRSGAQGLVPAGGLSIVSTRVRGTDQLTGTVLGGQGTGAARARDRLRAGEDRPRGSERGGSGPGGRRGIARRPARVLAPARGGPARPLLHAHGGDAAALGVLGTARACVERLRRLGGTGIRRAVARPLRQRERARAVRPRPGG